MIVNEQVCTTTAVGAATSNTFRCLAGQSSITISVTGFNASGTNITATLYNIVVTQLN
jgi:hypothetical protein